MFGSVFFASSFFAQAGLEVIALEPTSLNEVEASSQAVISIVANVRRVQATVSGSSQRVNPIDAEWGS